MPGSRRSQVLAETPPFGFKLESSRRGGHQTFGECLGGMFPTSIGKHRTGNERDGVAGGMLPCRYSTGPVSIPEFGIFTPPSELHWPRLGQLAYDVTYINAYRYKKIYTGNHQTESPFRISVGVKKYICRTQKLKINLSSLPRVIFFSFRNFTTLQTIYHLFHYRRGKSVE